jgi:molecular chaperone GrpE
MSKYRERNDVDRQADRPDKLADGVADGLPEDAGNGENVAETAENVAEIAEKSAEVTDNVAEELAKLKESYLRLMAEYDNYRKRTVKEKEELIRNGGEKTLVALLPVIDDFERARQTIDTAVDMEAVKAGVELIYSKFRAYLNQNGVKELDTREQPFDADLHEAVALIPATAAGQKGMIIETLQTGYRLNDRVIRHSKVVVAN